MYGEHLELITKKCTTCEKMVAMRVNPEDVRRHLEDGMFVQHAFADRNDVPYLTPAEREMWITGNCGECWAALCPADKTAYN